jgi:hypothetical protein
MADTKNIMLLVDGERCSLEDWLYTNTQDPDVFHITEEEAEKVKNLEVGESYNIWPLEVKRIA